MPSSDVLNSETSTPERSVGAEPTRDNAQDFDKREWAEQQIIRDAEAEKQKQKFEKTRARQARKAMRQIKKARLDLEKLGEMSEWEDEFTESVEERLDQFGSAFSDPGLGGAGDALSRLQKQALSQMRKKVRDKAKQSPYGGGADSRGAKDEPDPDAEYSRTYRPKSNDDDRSSKSSFKAKKSGFGRSSYTPRVRQIEDEIEQDEAEETQKQSDQVSIPSSEQLKERMGKSKRGGFRIIDGGKEE